MTKVLTTLALLITFSLSTQGQSSDYQAVEQTVGYYLQGGTNNDFETLKKAFHENATMKYITDEGYQEVNAIEFFQRVMKPGPPQNRTTQVVSISVSGHAASAQLQIDYETFSFIDHMNLLKIDGEWKIVSKIFYRKARTKN